MSYTILRIKFTCTLSSSLGSKISHKRFYGGALSDTIDKILNNVPTVHTITYFIWLFLTGSKERCQVYTTHVPISEGNDMGGQNNMAFLVYEIIPFFQRGLFFLRWVRVSICLLFRYCAKDTLYLLLKCNTPENIMQ